MPRVFSDSAPPCHFRRPMQDQDRREVWGNTFAKTKFRRTRRQFTCTVTRGRSKNSQCRRTIAKATCPPAASSIYSQGVSFNLVLQLPDRLRRGTASRLLAASCQHPVRRVRLCTTNRSGKVAGNKACRAAAACKQLWLRKLLTKYRSGLVGLTVGCCDISTFLKVREHMPVTATQPDNSCTARSTSRSSLANWAGAGIGGDGCQIRSSPGWARPGPTPLPTTDHASSAPGSQVRIIAQHARTRRSNEAVAQIALGQPLTSRYFAAGSRTPTPQPIDRRLAGAEKASALQRLTREKRSCWRGATALTRAAS